MELSGFLAIITGSPVHAVSSLAGVIDVSNAPRFVVSTYNNLSADYPTIVLVLLAIFVTIAIVLNRKTAVLVIPLLLITPFAATFTEETDVSRYFSFPILCIWVLSAVALTDLSKRYTFRYSTLVALCIPLAISAYELYIGRPGFEKPADHLGRTFVADVIRSTPNNAIIVAPWVYVTPLAYEAYAEKSFGRRSVVPFDIGNADTFLPAWLAKRPVYAISEVRPAAAIQTIEERRFHVNPDILHDPKLFLVTGFHRRS